MTIFEFANLVKNLNIDKLVDEVIEQNIPELLDLNTGQLSVGKNSEGQKVGEYSTDLYADFKKAIGSQAPSGDVDLKVSGDFFEGFKALIKPKVIEIFSDDEKAEGLEERYGSEIYGLTDENLDEWIEQLKVELIERIRNELRL